MCLSKFSTKPFITIAGSKCELFYFTPQGLITDVKDTWNGLFMFQKLLQHLGKLGRVDWVKSFLRILSMVWSIYDAIHHMSVQSLLRACLDIYHVVSEIADFSSQGLESVLLAASLEYLPKNIGNILKNISIINTVTNEYGLLYKLYDYFYQFIVQIFSSIPYVKDLDILKYLRLAPSFTEVEKLRAATSNVKNWKIKPRVMSDDLWRREAHRTFLCVLDNPYMKDWAKRSPAVEAEVLAISRCNKVIEAYERALRVEPSMFVFEGPPGCRKSVIATRVLDALNLTKYVHSVPPADNGKDFYDTYNEEDVMFCDDVGQMGASQWRPFINLVSSAKYPLQCAAADLKDTKFFNSWAIFCTTNRFMNLQGLIRSDGISEISALWRRGYVFDFSKLRGVGSNVIGSVQFLHKPLGNDPFIGDFPVELYEYCTQQAFPLKELGSSITVSGPNASRELSMWIAQIVLLFKGMKQQQFVENAYNTDHAYFAENLFFPQSSSESEMSDFNSDTWDSSSTFPPLEFDYEIEDDVSHYWGDFFTGLKDYLFDLLIEIGKVISSMDPVVRECLIRLVVLFAVVALANCLASPPPSKNVSDFVAQNSSLEERPVHTSVPFVQNNTLPVTVHVQNTNLLCYGLCSGHRVLLPKHVVPDNGFITIFKDRSKNVRLIDHAPFEIIYEDLNSDLCVVSLPLNMPTTFKNISHFFRPNPTTQRHDAWIINSDMRIALSSVARPIRDTTVFYRSDYSHYKSYENTLTNFVSYGVQHNAMCGTILFDTNVGIVGMHVAASVSRDIGVSCVWSTEVIQSLSNFMNDSFLFVDAKPKEKDREDFSAVDLALNFHLTTPKSSNFEPSPLHNSPISLFDGPLTKGPADLSIYGPHTVKDIEKKSLKPVKDIDIEDLKYAQAVLRATVPEFTDLSDSDVINGGEYLAGLNKQSSSGYSYSKSKDDYVNFSQATFSDIFEERLHKFEEDVLNGTYDPQDNLWAATLKDELRSLEKNRAPRSFRIAPLHIQVWTKRLFGDMVRKLLPHRHSHGIMIGINPYVEWDTIYQKLMLCGRKGEMRVWAGDIGDWDGSMLPQVQHAIADVLLEKYKGRHPVIAEYLLRTLPHCLVGMNDDVILTTHSLPSGSFLTAIVNSLMNKMYSSMCFHALYPNSSVSDFISGIVDISYGDDKLMGDLKDFPLFNNMNMCAYFESLGMRYTTSNKGRVILPYDRIEDITFLKRKFEYHPIIGRTMCPLDTSSMFSSISYLDHSKESSSVMQDKLHAFQREAFLHRHYDSLMKSLEESCTKRGVFLNRLDPTYLEFLFKYEANTIPYKGSLSEYV